jgi:mono/diheme cytochrome c family protein
MNSVTDFAGDIFGTTITLSLAAMIIGSHFGSNLTHGENFVWQPLRNDKEVEEKITDSSSLFAAAIRPILKSKCFTCHNEKKAKGGLIMTTEEKILEGGKNGPIWKSGDALNSHIIQKINLPEDEKKHMPPKGKPQLSQEQIDLLFAWIQSGADMKKTMKDYADDDTLKILAAKFIHLPKEETEKTYSFAASTSTIQKLSGPFVPYFHCHKIHQRCRQISLSGKNLTGKNWKTFKSKRTTCCAQSWNMPVTDADMKTINQFTNLEKLILNNSLITNSALNEIKKLKSLQSLSLAGTQIDKNAAQSFSQFDSLKEVFIWNTKFQQPKQTNYKSKTKR